MKYEMTTAIQHRGTAQAGLSSLWYVNVNLNLIILKRVFEEMAAIDIVGPTEAFGEAIKSLGWRMRFCIRILDLWDRIAAWRRNEDTT